MSIKTYRRPETVASLETLLASMAASASCKSAIISTFVPLLAFLALVQLPQTTLADATSYEQTTLQIGSYANDKQLVSISSDGSTMAATRTSAQAYRIVAMYRRENGQWVYKNDIEDATWIDGEVNHALSGNGNEVAVVNIRVSDATKIQFYMWDGTQDIFVPNVVRPTILSSSLNPGLAQYAGISYSHYHGLGSSLKFSDDGNSLVVGARWGYGAGVQSGVAFVFDYIFDQDTGTGSWKKYKLPFDTLTSSYDRCGSSVDISADGNRVVVACPRQTYYLDTLQVRSVFILERSAFDTAFNVKQQLTNTVIEQFAYAVALYGDRIAVGIPNEMTKTISQGVVEKLQVEGKVRIFELVDGTWTPYAEDIVGPLGEWFGASVDMYNNMLVVGSPSSDALAGRVRLYEIVGANNVQSMPSFNMVGSIAGDGLGNYTRIGFSPAENKYYVVASKATDIAVVASFVAGSGSSAATGE